MSKGTVALLIVASGVIAYANAFGASFQFDDWNAIVDEKRVQGLVAWWHSMPGIRPLLKLSYALNYEISAAPFGYHAANIVIHAINAWLIFALLAKRTTRFVALTTALIFALHPVQTEAVTYVMGRSCSLSTLFVLLSLYVTGWLAPLFFACALGVRETAVMAVFVKAADARGRLPWKRVVVPFSLMLAVAGAIALAIPKYRHLLSVSLHARDVGTNLLTQANGVCWLIGQLVRIDRLNVDPYLPVISSWTWTVAAQSAFILGLIALGFTLLRRHPAVGFGVLWFFLWLLPTNSFLPRLDVANDRQLYLALAGPAFLVGYGLGKLAERRRLRASIAVAVLCAVLGVATHLRNRVYRDELTFWSDVVTKAPHNARAHNNLGYALALAHRDDEAEAEFRRALELDPEYYKAVFNLMFLQEGTLRERRESH
jgi:hypothetical protein